MGFFSKKDKFDISPETKKVKSVVTRLDENIIKINAKLTVPQGYSFLIGKNGKTLDEFNEGEHFFEYSNLPYICRKYGIDKIRNGERLDKISADLYLVSKELRGASFKTYRKVEMGTKAYGIFKAHVYGIYSYKVVNAKEFMQSLLNQFDYIKSGEAEDILSAWVEEAVVDELEKQNFIIDDVVKNNPKIAEVIKARLEKLFKILGLEIVELKITKYKLPKKYQEQNEKYMNKQEDNTENSIAQDELQTDGEEDNALQNQANEREQTEQTDEVADYVPFGNIKIEEYNGEIDKQETEKQKTFVDLNVNQEYYNEAKNTKRCLNCGTENDIGADHCVICGEVFNNDEI